MASSHAPQPTPANRLLSPEQIAAGSLQPPAQVRLPQQASACFSARAARLEAWSAGHVWSEFLGFAARLARAQAQVAEVLEGTAVVLPAPGAAGLPLDIQQADLSGLSETLGRLLTAFRAGAAQPPAVEAALARLGALPPATLGEQARAILNAAPVQADPASAPFLGAALQVLWTTRAARLAQQGSLPVPTAEHGLCPLCGSHPVGSIQRIGDGGALRYVVCALCATEWHVVRVKCVSCQSTQGIAYQGLKGEGAERFAGVQVETCDQCHSSLKFCNMEKDLAADPFADDLATLELDILVGEAGYARAGRNLFFFPGA